MKDQSKAPVPKVAAGGLAGATTLVVVWIAGLLGLEIPPTVAAALTVIFTSGVAYLKPA